MRSAGTRAFTIVTIVTLLFTPVFNKHGKEVGKRLVDRSSVVTRVECGPQQPCPARKTIVREVMRDGDQAGEPAGRTPGRKHATKPGATKKNGKRRHGHQRRSR
jgi:hypothetical protein